MRGIVHRHSNNWFEWAQAYKRQLLQPFPLSPSACVVGGRRRLSKARLMQFYRLAKSSCVGPLRVIAQRPLYDPSAIIYLCLDEGLCHHKRACVIRRQKHLRLAKRHIIERIADIKIPDEMSKPFEKLEWAGGKRLDLAEYMREHPYMYMPGRYSVWQRPWQAMSSTCPAQRRKKKALSLLETQGCQDIGRGTKTLLS